MIRSDRTFTIFSGCAPGQYETAVDYFQQAVQLNPASAIDHANLALNQEKTGQLEEALANYQVALSIDPDIEFARTGLERVVSRLS